LSLFGQPSEAKVANEEARVEAAPTKFGLVLAEGRGYSIAAGFFAPYSSNAWCLTQGAAAL
jgi:hypothetical protein